MTKTAAPPIDPLVWRIGVVTVLGTVMSVLDTTIVNVALDPLARELDTSLSTISWVVTAYLLAIAAVTPAAGWASRRIGTRRLYLISLVLFTLGSIACGLAWGSTSLIVARVFQGAGGGLLLPVGQQIVVGAAGRENLGRVMGVLGVPTVLAPVFGPTVGGFLLEHVSWRAVFLINAPIGVVALVLALRLLPRDTGQATYPLDVTGLVLGSVGLGLVVYGLSEVATQPALVRAGVVLPVAAGLVLLTLFVRGALRREHPLLDLRLFADRTYSLASFAFFVNGAISLGALILLPLYLQQVRGESATVTGALVAPTAVGVVLVMRKAGRLTDVYGGGQVATVGTVIVALATLPFAWLDQDTSYTFLVVVMLVRGIGVGLAGMPLMAAALVSMPARSAADATAQLFVLQRVGGSLGTALFVVVLERTADFGTTFGLVAALTALSVVPCVLLAASQRRTAIPVALAD